jgi:hypothetical protein
MNVKKGFLSIKKIAMPVRYISEAYAHLREKGKQRLEGLSLFAGTMEGDRFCVTENIIPDYTSLALGDGLLYCVDEEELHRINVYLFSRNLRMIDQMHSHPARAYHSETDDAFPIISTVGGVSIVVPDFAVHDPEIDSWAVYRLYAENQWKELNRNQKLELIEFTN